MAGGKVEVLKKMGKMGGSREGMTADMDVDTLNENGRVNGKMVQGD